MSFDLDDLISLLDTLEPLERWVNDEFPCPLADSDPEMLHYGDCEGCGAERGSTSHRDVDANAYARGL